MMAMADKTTSCWIWSAGGEGGVITVTVTVPELAEEPSGHCAAGGVRHDGTKRNKDSSWPVRRQLFVGRGPRDVLGWTDHRKPAGKDRPVWSNIDIVFAGTCLTAHASVLDSSRSLSHRASPSTVRRPSSARPVVSCTIATGHISPARAPVPLSPSPPLQDSTPIDCPSLTSPVNLHVAALLLELPHCFRTRNLPRIR